MPTGVIELRFQGVVVRLDQDWQHSDVSELHGVFIEHASVGLTMHLRGWHRSGDADWLRRELHAQNWLGPPTEVRERTIDDRAIIGGTFLLPEPDQVVREWFLGDGRRSANAMVVFAADLPRAQLEPYEQLLDTVSFSEP